MRSASRTTTMPKPRDSRRRRASPPIEAAVRSARIDLGYTRRDLADCRPRRAIHRDVGRARHRQPAAGARHVQQLDPIYVDVTQSSAELLRLRRRLRRRRADERRPERGARHLLLEDGTAYPLDGRLQFTEVNGRREHRRGDAARGVPEPRRGAAAGDVRARRARAKASSEDALLVPQQGHLPRSAGASDGPGARRPTARWSSARSQTTGRSAIAGWSRAGLSAGDRVIVEGLQKVHGPGARGARDGRHLQPRRSAAVGVRACPASSSTGRSSRGSSRSSSCSRARWSITTLPVAQYPAIAPPAISINATYPGASAKTLEDTVTQVIEQQHERPRRPALHRSSSDASGTADDHADVRPAVPIPTSRRCRCRTSCSWRRRSSRRKCSAGRAGDQVARELPHGRRPSSRGRQPHRAPTSPTSSPRTVQDPLSRVPGVGDVHALRLAVRDAHLARSGQAGELLAHPGRRARRSHRRRTRRSPPDSWARRRRCPVSS